MNGNQRRLLWDDAADAACGYTMTCKSSEGCIRGFGRDGNEQAAGGLRVEEKILIFGSNGFVESSAIRNESAVVFEASGKMPFASGFESAGKINKGRVIELERDRLDTMRWVTQRHLSRMTEQAEPGHIRHGVDGCLGWRYFFQLLQRGSGGAIERGHGSDGGRERFGCGAILFQRSRYNASPERFCEEQSVSGASADIPPNSVGIDQSRYCITEKHVFIANRMAANDAALRFIHFHKAAAHNLFENFRIAFFGKPDDGKRGNRPASHGVDVAERVGGGDLTEKLRGIHDRREKIDGLDEREAFAEQVDSCVIVRIKAHENVGIGLTGQFAQDEVERCGIQFCGASRGLCHRREFHLCDQVSTSLPCII